jgi:hypothetical protein
MIKKTNLILVLLFAIFTFSCSNDDDKQPLVTTGISQEIKDLISFTGDEDAPIVVINTQGGPGTELSTEEANFIFENFNSTNLLAVNVHQAQTLNPNLFESNDITFDQAINFNAESIETLYQVVKYFKDDGRTVYVLGVSFGAFMVQELIAEKGVDIADNYLIMVGRLDMNDVIWQGLSEGRFGYFENGIDPIVDEEEDPDVTERNMGRLAAGLAMNRYTELLNIFEDLSNITYVYGETDQAVGRLTDAEIEFLQSKNVNIIAGSGGHDQTINDFIVQSLNEAFVIE